MKMNLFRIGAVALAAAVALVACNKPADPTPAATPVATLTAASSTFVDDAATLSVNLSAAPAADVTLVLEASGTIPASALTFNKNVTVPAGQTKAEVPVKVNSANLENGATAVFTLASASGATLSEAAKSVTLTLKKEVPQIKVVEVNMDAPQEFTDGIATLKIYASDAPEADVTVKVTVTTDLPAELIAYEGSVVLPAGSTADVESLIVVDVESMEPGDYTVTATISVDSEYATVGSQNSATLPLHKMGATLREDWKVYYDGREYSTEEKLLDWIVVEGWEGEYYDLFTLPEGALEYYGGDMLAIMQLRHENYLGKYLGEYSIDQLLLNKTGDIAFNLMDPGKYELYLIDYTAAGMYTGQYACSTFEIEEGEATDAYAANLGIYKVTGTGKHYNTSTWKVITGDVTIDKVGIYSDVNNESYEVCFFFEYQGKEYYYPGYMDYNAQDGSLAFNSQQLDEWTDDDYGKVEDWQYGYYYNQQKKDLYYITGVGYSICEAAAPENGQFVMNASTVQLKDGSKITLDGLWLIGFASETAFLYVQLPFPATFTRIADLPEEEGDAVQAAAASVRAFRPQAQRPIRIHKSIEKAGVLMRAPAFEVR